MRTLQRRLVRVAAACSLLPAMVLLIAATPYQQSEPRRSLSRDDLKVGQLLEINAVRTGKDTIVASEIDVSDAKLEARIQEVDVANSSLHLLGLKVVVSPETMIMDRNKEPIDLSTLQSGSNVVANGLLQNDGTVLAARIKAKKAKTNGQVIIEGILEGIDQNQNTLTVLGIAVSVTADTYIEFD